MQDSPYLPWMEIDRAESLTCVLKEHDTPLPQGSWVLHFALSCPILGGS